MDQSFLALAKKRARVAAHMQLGTARRRFVVVAVFVFLLDIQYWQVVRVDRRQENATAATHVVGRVPTGLMMVHDVGKAQKGCAGR